MRDFAGKSLTSYLKSLKISGSAGGVPERLKGADCKSVGLAPTLVRIQPPPPHCRMKREVKLQGAGWLEMEFMGEATAELKGGCSSMAEQKPSKLMTRVRFPSPAPELRTGSGTRSSKCVGPCSSVVEHSLGKGEVMRSIRIMGTKG